MYKLKDPSEDTFRPKLVVFTGDNFFSYILCSQVCKSQLVTDIVVSRGTTNSLSKIKSIFQKTSINILFIE